ncbi:hypothetical protein OHV05_05895 [Kitasatospora sp. NBC_00070]|uniref:hypothetical protein n=1 Tax=Kitasatospora sp. NBC_00070 TaxID=2975962 RepID=UPI0032496405
MRILRKLAIAATALALAAPVALAPTAQASVPAAQGAEQRANRIYISPWGSAQVRVSDTTKAWLIANDVKLGAIEPFTLDADGFGFNMPIGSTAGDHLDEKGRIFYPGGITLKQESSQTFFELVPTWIRIMPQPGYSAGVKVNGEKLSDETLIAYTTPAEVIANGRPTLTGFKLDRVPFHVTADAATLTKAYFGDGLKADSMFGTLTPNFDYVPTN